MTADIWPPYLDAASVAFTDKAADITLPRYMAADAAYMRAAITYADSRRYLPWRIIIFALCYAILMITFYALFSPRQRLRCLR